MCTRLDVTTNRGLEELVVQELERHAATAGVAGARGICRPDGLDGWVRLEAETTGETMRQLALGLRSIHHVVRPLHRFTLDAAEPLAQVRAEVAALRVPELEPEGVRFRVTTRRTGEHGFTSEEVQREAGAGVRARALREVSLKEWDVNLRVDVRGDQCLIGVQLTREPLTRRHSRPFLAHMSLQSNIAWALLRLARPERDASPDAVLDPFCGSGTILLEAGAMWPDARLYGSDTSEESAAGMRSNLAAAGLSGEARVGDARAIAAVWEGRRFDTVVSNPPFGRRIGPNMSFESLFGDVLDGLLELTDPGARVALLVYKRGAFNRALRNRPAYVLRHARVVELGGLHPCIMVLDRLDLTAASVAAGR